MILKIELENFFSIKDKICLDFRAGHINTNQARELAHNVIQGEDYTLLKTIGLFGPNASGKSNILKAINFCCRMILRSHTHNEGAIFNFQPFKFDGWDKKVSKFLIDFICEGIEYEYSFSLTREQIIEESLFYYPNGRRAKVFIRENGDDYRFSPAIPRAGDISQNTSPKNLFLSRASSMNRELAQKLYRYFLSTFMLGIIPLNNHSIEQLFEEYKEVVVEALSICDSDICEVQLLHEKRKGYVIGVDVQELTSTIMEGQEKDDIRFVTYHKFLPQEKFDMFTEESEGTQQLFALLLRLLDVVKNQKALMVDEFDLSLHTKLAEFVIDLIHASERSQFLFTSHNTNLIDVKRFRKDQILFVKKNDQGATEVYPLYDFKDFRENMDAEKGYLQGRFDAVPIVDSSVERLKAFLSKVP